MSNRRIATLAIAGTCVAGFGALASGRASAQGTFPSRAVQLTIPFPAGGVSDILGRLVADSVAKVWGQPVVVLNRVGASGVIGAKQVSKSAPDGYSLLSTVDSTLITAGLVSPPAQIDIASDLTPIAELARGGFVLACHPSLPVKNFAELIAYAKKNPGKISYGSAGVGTAPHLIGEMLKVNAGIDMVHIPYAGSAPFMLALRTGELQLGFLFSSEAVASINAGHVRALATPSPKRLARFPTVPTIAEEGYADVRDESSLGLLGPAGMDRSLAEKISADVLKSSQLPGFRERLDELGYLPVFGTPSEYAAVLRDTLDRRAKVVSQAKIKA